MPDCLTAERPPAILSDPSAQEILIYLAATKAARRPAPSLTLLSDDTCISLPVEKVKSKCSLLRAADLIDWVGAWEPRTRHDNGVVLTVAGAPIARALLQAAGEDAPRLPEVKERHCLTCREPFTSDGRHNWMCKRCKALDIV